MDLPSPNVACKNVKLSTVNMVSCSTQLFILPRLIKWVTWTSGDLVVKVTCLLKVALQPWDIWILSTKRILFKIQKGFIKISKNLQWKITSNNFQMQPNLYVTHSKFQTSFLTILASWVKTVCSVLLVQNFKQADSSQLQQGSRIDVLKSSSNFYHLFLFLFQLHSSIQSHFMTV